MYTISIRSTGYALPERIITNDDLSQIVDTSDEWIFPRTGIHSRRFVGEGQSANSMAIEAAKKALRTSGINKEELGVILVATLSGDYATPSVACMVQQALELPKDIPVMDINAACSGFCYALETARALLMAGADKKRPYGLIIGTEELSKILDMTDRSTCVLFGDGAGAVVIEAGEGEEEDYASILGADGGLAISCDGVGKDHSYVKMDGKDVFRFAVKILPRCIRGLFKKSGTTQEDIDWFVCHQANARIIDHVVRFLKADDNKFFRDMDHLGNTSGASIPLALGEMNEQGLLTPGNRLMLIGFGSGLTWGGILLKYVGPVHRNETES
ncbi:MAG: ketoacyl-ACP synthase III [Lachnospiraceae bacterium]|nr:ketoacyl-ACP synthase III [Lachnospiraceae bacterium]